MKADFHTTHRLAPFAKKINNRSGNGRAIDESNDPKVKMNNKERIVVTKVMMQEPADIADVRVKADEDRPE